MGAFLRTTTPHSTQQQKPNSRFQKLVGRPLVKTTILPLLIIMAFSSITLAQVPVISSVEFPAGNYKIGSQIDIQIAADGAGYDLDAASVVSGQALTNFTDEGGGNYTARYTVVEGDGDHAAVTTIPISIVLDNGGDTNLPFTTPTTAGAPTTVTIDATRPVGAVSYTANPINDGTAQTITINFGEALSGTPKIALSGQKTVSATDMSGGTTVWTYDDGSTHTGNGTVTVTVSVATDAAGNEVASATTNGSYVIDNNNPSFLSTADSGDGSYRAGETITFDVNLGETGATVTADLSVINSGFSSTQALADDGDGTYSFTTIDINNGGLMQEGTAVAVTFSATDAANNGPVTNNSLTLLLDKTPPSFTSIGETGDGNYRAGETITFDVNLGESGLTVTADLSVVNSGFSTTQPLADDGDGTYSFTTIDINNGGLMQEGSAVAITFSASDDAGNGPVTNNSLTIELDKTLPSFVSTSETGDGSYRAGETITFDVDLGEAGLIVTANLAVINSGFSTTQALADDGDGTYSFTTIDIDDGTNMQEGSSIAINFSATDDAGNNAADNSLTLLLDKTAPTVSATGPANSSFVNNTSVSFDFSEAIASGSVTFTRIGGSPDGSSPHIQALSGSELDGGTKSNITLTNDPTLVDGAIYNISFDGIDAAGNIATTVTNTNITYDVSGPSFTAVLATPNSGTRKVNDNIIVNLTATGLESGLLAGTIMTINGENVKSTFTDNANGTYTLTYDIDEGDDDRLALNSVPINLDFEDNAGNSLTVSAFSDGLSPIIDANTPLAPTGLDLATADDTGNNTADNLTKNDTDLTISGPAASAEAGTTIQLYNGGVLIGGASTTAAGNGSWTIDIDLTETSHIITARSTDAAGNQSAASSPLNITVDTSPPGAPTLPNLASGDDSGQLDNDNITKQTTNLTFSGTAEASSTVQLFVDGGPEGTPDATGGSWSINLNKTEGIYSITAQATDDAGNVGPQSGALSLTVDTSPPQVTLASLLLYGVNDNKNPLEYDTLEVFFNEPLGHIDGELLSYVDSGSPNTGVDVDDPNTDEIPNCNAEPCTADTDRPVTKAEYRLADNAVLLTAAFPADGNGNVGSWPRWDHGDENENDETASGFYYTTVGGTNGGGGIFDIAGNELQALGVTDSGQPHPDRWVFDVELENGDNSPPELSPDVMTLYPRGDKPDSIVFLIDDALNIPSGTAVTGFSVSTGSIDAVNSKFESVNDASVVYLLSTSNYAWTDAVTVSYSGGNIANSAGQPLADITNHVVVYETDAPSITSLTIASDNTVNTLAKGGETITLSFTADDGLDYDNIIFTNVNSGGSPIANSVSISPMTDVYTYTATFAVDAGDSDGLFTFTLNYTDEAGNAGTTLTQADATGSVTIDNTPPVINSIVKADSDPHNAGVSAGSVDFTVTFDEPVNGVDIGDFLVLPSSTNLIGTPMVASVNASSGTVFTVTVNDFDLDNSAPSGTVNLDLDASQTITNNTGIDNVSAVVVGADETYTIINPEPAQAIAFFSSTGQTTTSIDLTWTNSAVDQIAYQHLVLVKETASFSTPTDGVFVNDDLDLTTGTLNQQAINVPHGQNSLTVNNLNSATNYDFVIYPYTNDGGNVNYKTTSAATLTNIPTTAASVSTISTESALATLSSLSTTRGSASVNFTFKIWDDGGETDDNIADNAKTLFSQLKVTQGANNQVTDWTTIIAGAELSSEGDDLNSDDDPLDVTINPDNILFDNIPTTNENLGEVDDDEEKIYTLKVWLLNPMADGVDNLQLDFELDQDQGALTLVANSSGIDPTPALRMASSGVNNNVIDVQATEIRFVTEPAASPAVDAVLAQQPIVWITDARGNRDLDQDNVGLTVVNAQNIPMDNVPTTTANGILTFPGFAYLDDGDGLSGNGTLTVYDGAAPGPLPLADATSATVHVTYSNDTRITASNNLIEPGSISSLVNAQIDEIAVFDFQIQDDVSPTVDDGTETRISQIVIAQSTDNDDPIDQWTKIIAGATLADDAGNSLTIFNGNPELTDNTLVFDIDPANLGNIQDDATKVYTLSIWLLSSLDSTLADVVDNKIFGFQVDETNITLESDTFGPQSSTLSSFGTNSGSTTAIDVDATQISVIKQPPAEFLVNTDFAGAAPVIEGQDANLNRDLDYEETVTIVDNNGLTISNQPTVFVDGIAQFATDFQYDVIGNAQLSITPATITPILSNTFLIRVAASTLITTNGGQAEPATFASTNDATPGNFVFDFTIEDDAGAEDDGNATLITDLVIQQAAGFNDIALADWTQVIEGATLFDDEGPQNSITGTIGASTITFSGLNTASGEIGFIGDDASKVYELHIWLKDSIDFRISGFTFPMTSYMEPTVTVDNKKLEFSISEVDITTDVNGSGVRNGETLASGDANSIDVDATDLDFSIEPPAVASVNTPYQVRTEARDANDNRDVDFGFSLDNNVTNQGNLVMLNAPTTADNFTAGVFDFNSLFQYDEAGASPAGRLTLEANSITATSQDIEVIASFDSYLTVDNTFLQTDINSIQYDSDDITNDGVTDVEIARFTLFDGQSPTIGGAFDVDGAITNLTELDFTIQNLENLKRVAIYVEDIDGNGDGLGTFSEIDEIDVSGYTDGTQVVFTDNSTGLFSAEDDKTRLFRVIASFRDIYDDNEVIVVTINNALTGLGASQLDLAVAFPATEANGTLNRVEVTATQLDFNATLLDAVQGIFIPITPAQPQVFANDGNGNLDLDFGETVVITSAGGANIGGLPPRFSNLNPGILDFPDFEYTGTGNGTITVTAFNGLTQTSNVVDVVHTLFNNLDLGSSSTSLNNGIEALPEIKAGGTNKAVIGFSLSSIQNTLNEPTLNELIVRFGNDITTSLFNIRLVSSPNPKYTFTTSSLVSNNDVPGTNFATFQNINVDLTSMELYYFVIADIFETADFTTPIITPSIIADAIPDNFVANEDVKLSSGSVDAAITGRTYGFKDDNPPIITSLTPENGNDNFPQSNLISIEFNEPVVALDPTISIYRLIDNSLVTTLVPDVTLTIDDRIFFYNPDPIETPIDQPSLLEGDVIYYILLEPGDALQSTGFLDRSGNEHEGILTSSVWTFKTSDNVPPYFTGDLSLSPYGIPDTLQADAVNILDVGFDLRVALDEPGKVYYVVVDPDVTTGTPLVDEIRNGTFPGTIVSGEADILKGLEYHYVSIFDDTNFPTPSAGDENFRVWMTAEDISLPTPNQMVDGDPNHPGVEQVDGTFEPNPGGGVIIQNTPLNEPVDICIGEHQIIFAPINIVEGQNNDFNVGNGQTMNFILPPDFEYKTDNVTIIGQGDDISNVNFSFINNTILSISYDISGTSGRDKLVIGGMEVKALGAAGTTGDIIRLGGTGAFPAIPDGTVLVSLNTIQSAPVTFITDPNSSAIGDVNEKVPLIANISAIDQGTTLYSGPGVFGDTLYIAAAGLGSHEITLNYTSEFGCTSEFSLTRTIFDSDRAIAGLEQVYNTNSDSVVISIDGLDDFDLIGLGVEIAPIQTQDDGVTGPFNEVDPFTIDVRESLDTLVNGNYVFYPDEFRLGDNFDKYTVIVTDTINEGGLIGELLFTGVYENEFDTNLRDTLEQTVQVYFSPTPELSFTRSSGDVVGPFGEETFDFNNTPEDTVAGVDEFIPELEFCEYEQDIALKGSSSDGYFAITIPYLNIFHSRTNPGLTDNQDGTGSLNLQDLVDKTIGTVQGTPTRFLFGEVRVSFTIIRPESTDSVTVEQSIRVNATPRADYIVRQTLCEDTPLLFEDATALAQLDQARVDSLPSKSFASAHDIVEWEWNFNDPEDQDLQFDEDISHTFIEPDVYDIVLTVKDSYGCMVDTLISKAIGGLPVVGFTFGGATEDDQISFRSNSTVFRSAELPYSIDSVGWDFDMDGEFDLWGSDVDSVDALDDNDYVYSVSGSDFGDPGLYNVNFIAKATEGCATETTRFIEILKVETIEPGDDNPYSETFETGAVNWVAYPELSDSLTLDGDNSWNLGSTYVGANISLGAEQGSNIWNTIGEDSVYKSEERSYLYSPAFDIRNLERPMVQFDIFRDLASQDGVIFEYSTDSLNIHDPNKVWLSLGEDVGEGIEWFNAKGLAGNPGNDPTGLGWEKADSEDNNWVKAKHDLAEIYADANLTQVEIDKLKSRVVFRFGLGAISGAKKSNEFIFNGFAFDNIRLGNRTRTVLLENFTSLAGAGNSVENDSIRNLELNNPGAELVVLSYHTSLDGEDPINKLNPSHPGARAMYYGIDQNQRVVIDGYANPYDNPSNELAFTDWGKRFYSVRTLQISPFAIDVDLNDTDGKLGIDVELTAKSDEIINDFSVHVAIVADSLSTQELIGGTADSGEDEIYNTLITMLPDAAGITIEGGMARDEVTTVSTTWDPYDIIDPTSRNLEKLGNRLRVVVFIQDHKSKEVHQATYADLATQPSALNLVLGVEDQLTADEISLYPNPADHEINIEFTTPMREGKNAMIIDHAGKVIEEVYLNQGQKRLELPTSAYTPGIYLFSLPTDDGPVIKRFVVSHR